MKTALKTLALVTVASLPVAQAQAATDLTNLSAAIDFSTITPAILSAGALGIAILLAWVAVKYVRRVVRSA